MPVFMKFDGVDGSVTAHHGGVLVVMGDGSVRFLRDSIDTSFDGGPKVVVYSGSTDSNAPVNALEVSRISLPDSSRSGGINTIDSRDANAALNARTLFQSAAGFNSASGIIISISKIALSRAAAKMTGANNLKQIGLAAHSIIPALKFLIFDGGNSKGVRVEMKNVLVSSYQISTTDGGGIPLETYTLNFAQIKFAHNGHKFSLTRHYD